MNQHANRADLLELSGYARLVAQSAEGKLPFVELLAAHGVSLEAWQKAAQHWAERFAEQPELAVEFGNLVGSEQQSLAEVVELSVFDWGRLNARVDQGEDLVPVLTEFGLSNGDYFRYMRRFLEQSCEDEDLASLYEQAYAQALAAS